MIHFEGEPDGVRIRVFGESHTEIHQELLTPDEAYRLGRKLQDALFEWNELNGGLQRIDKENPA